MLKTQMRRLANRRAAADQRVVDIKLAIIMLTDEDLLDLADIFRSEPKSPLAEMALAEMAKRNISL